MQTQKKQQIQLTSSRQNMNSQLESQLSFNSVPLRLNLISQEIHTAEQIPQDHVDAKTLVEAYKKSYKHLSSYSRYLDFQLSKATTAKLLLKQTIITYQEEANHDYLIPKELNLLVLLLNTVHYLNIQQLIRALDLASDRYQIQSKILVPGAEFVVGEVMQAHLQELQQKKGFYFEKFTRFNSLYKQTLSKKTRQLLSARPQRASYEDNWVIDTVKRIEEQKFVPISQLLSLVQHIYNKAKTRIANLQNLQQLKHLRVLFLIKRLISLQSSVVVQSYVSSTYLSEYRHVSFESSPQQMVRQVLQPSQTQTTANQ